jgi:hypothetical protein
MYDEIFNQEDFESELEDNSKETVQEGLDIEFPMPKKELSLDEMMKKYGFTIFKEWPKATNQEVKKNAGR